MVCKLRLVVVEMFVVMVVVSKSLVVPFIEVATLPPLL